jgi:hypothetical protein
LNVEKTVVFGYTDSDKEDSINKAGPKSTVSFTKRKGRAPSMQGKSFKEFKPKPTLLNDPLPMHPRLVKEREKERIELEIENKNQPFPIPNLEVQIEKLRKKVENEAKRRKIEEELKKKKRTKVSQIGSSTVNIGNKPFTTDDDGKPLIIKSVNPKRLPNHETNQSTQINLNEKNAKYGKIIGLEHLYMIPKDSVTKPQTPEIKAKPVGEESHVQEITALQPPPSEVLTLKAGVILNENGNVLNGPDPEYKNRMTKDQYITTLGSQSMQRKKFHEQRVKDKVRLNTSFNPSQDAKGTNKLSLKELTSSKFQKDKSRKGILKTRMQNNYSTSTFYRQDPRDQIMINKNAREWKEELISEKFTNPKKSDSKYSAAINDSYQSVGAAPYGAERSLSQNSFYDTSIRTYADRPNTSFQNYGETTPEKSKMHSTLSKRINSLKMRSSSIQNSAGRRTIANTSFDKVRNYKSKMFKDSAPIYGAIDAFNRQILKNAHEEAGSGGLRSKNIALRPISKLSDEKDMGRQTLYPSLMKKPRDRVKEEIKNMIVFRRTFGNKFS